ncbi:MAG: T9SS type A sorting domain-containing protein [Chlorobi bacterium]|nr:T9SS type A sorting domain-containing protein [Chlorobiota bacterium]
MKRTLAAFIFTILTGLSINGQGFLSADKQWNVRNVFYPAGYSTEIYRIQGDSVINSVDYKKIWVSFDSLSTWSFQGLLREDSNIVYYKAQDAGEGILYDFNLEAGDSAYVKNVFCPDQDIPVYVLDVDTVEYFGVSRKRWHLDSDGGNDEYWVEGIGSLNGPLYTKYWYCIICPVWELLCYHEGNTLLYILPDETECYQNTVGIEENQGRDHITISPNPVTRGNAFEIESDISLSAVSLFSASGILIRRLSLAADHSVRIETGGLNPGLYLLSIRINQNKIRTCKIIIK